MKKKIPEFSEDRITQDASNFQMLLCRNMSQISAGFSAVVMFTSVLLYIFRSW